MNQNKVNLLRKTLQAATSLRGGDLASVTAPLGISSGNSEPASGWDATNYFFQAFQTQGAAAGAGPAGAQALPALSGKQQDGQAQLNSPRQGWMDNMAQPQAWPPQALLDYPAPSLISNQLIPPAGPPLNLANTGQQQAGPSRALLTSLLTRKVPTDVSRALQQAGAKRPPTLGGSHQVPSRRPLSQQQPSPPRPPRSSNARGSARSIALNKDITATATINQLLALVTAHGHEFDFFNISTAISRMPKLVGDHTHHAHTSQRPEQDYSSAPAAPGQQPKVAAVAGAASNAAHLSAAVKEVADRLCALALRHVHEFDGRGLANTAWAFAKLRYVPDPALPAALCRASVARIDQFAAQNVSNLAWALVYLHYQDEQLMQLLKRKACDQVYEMKPQELANTMWALASHEQLDAQTAHVLGERAARLAGQFKEQELSNVVWALGRCGLAYDPSLLEPLLAVVRSRIASFMPQGVSNMVWALGQLGHHDPALLAVLTHECPKQLHNYDAQALSNLATGLAALGSSSVTPLMTAVAHEAAVRGARMPQQHLATILASAAAVRVHNDRLVAAAVDALHTRASCLEPSTLASLAGAALSLGAHLQPPASPIGSMLAPLVHAVMACADKLHGQALASLIVHFSQMGGAAGAEVLPALAARLPAAMPSLTPQQTTAVAQALQVSGALTLDAAPALLRHALMPPAHEGQEAEYAAQLSAAVSAAARVGYVPDAHMQEALLVAVHTTLPHMNEDQLYSSCWALAGMGVLNAGTLLAAVSATTCSPMATGDGYLASQYAQPPPPPPSGPRPALMQSNVLGSATGPYSAEALAAVQALANVDLNEACYEVGAAAIMNAARVAAAVPNDNNKARVRMPARSSAPHSPTASMRQAQQAGGRPAGAVELNPSNLQGWNQMATGAWQGNGQAPGPRRPPPPPPALGQSTITPPNNTPNRSARVSESGSVGHGPVMQAAPAHLPVQQLRPALQGAVFSPFAIGNGAAMFGGGLITGRADSLEDVGGGFWLPRDLLAASPAVSLTAPMKRA